MDPQSRPDSTQADAVIVSAGKGYRFMEGIKKQFHLLAEKPILAHTLEPFETCSLIRFIFLVVGEEDLDYCMKEIVEKYRYRKVSRIIPGGKRRQDSVKNGIDVLPEDTEVVVIHDGVRPFVTGEMIEGAVQSAYRLQAVVFAMPVKDTIKTAHTNGTVRETLNRESLWQVQTPQAFQAGVIKQAYAQAGQDGFFGTDDASLVERLGVKVHILQGSYNNIKITTPEDWALANFLFERFPSGQSHPSGRRKKR